MSIEAINVNFVRLPLMSYPWIASPDLIRPHAEGSDLNEPNPKTFYDEGPVGYTDYPFLE